MLGRPSENLPTALPSAQTAIVLPGGKLGTVVGSDFLPSSGFRRCFRCSSSQFKFPSASVYLMSGFRHSHGSVCKSFFL